MSAYRLAILVVTVWFDALCGGMAQAHALLVASDPASEAVLDAAPTAVTLRFNEPMAPLTLDWLLPTGASCRRGDGAGRGPCPCPARHDGGQLCLVLAVASTDGHPVAGALVFAIGASTLTAPVDQGTEPLVWVGAALRGWSLLHWPLRREGRRSRC